jgi:hypothetical protein
MLKVPLGVNQSQCKLKTLIWLSQLSPRLADRRMWQVDILGRIDIANQKLPNRQQNRYALLALRCTIDRKFSGRPNHSFAWNRLDFGSDHIVGQCHVHSDSQFRSGYGTTSWAWYVVELSTTTFRRDPYVLVVNVSGKIAL